MTSSTFNTFYITTAFTFRSVQTAVHRWQSFLKVSTGDRFNQSYSEYKHSLTFRVRCYVVIAMKPVSRLQICPIMHN